MTRRLSFSCCGCNGLSALPGLGVLALAVGLAAPHAGATGPNPEAATPAPSGTVYKTEVINNDHWITVCRYTDSALRQRTCGTSVRVTEQNTNRLLLVFSVFRDGQRQLQGVLIVPTGVMIAPGASLAIDGGPETRRAFTACEPADCVAALPVDQTMIERLRKATTGIVHFTLQNGKVQSVSFPMGGFAQALPYLQDIPRRSGR
jgi:invasion protein IalB